MVRMGYVIVSSECDSVRSCNFDKEELTESVARFFLQGLCHQCNIACLGKIDELELFWDMEGVHAMNLLSLKLWDTL